MGAMFVGSEFCPHCGAKVAAPRDTGAGVLRCPGCASDMPQVRLGSTLLHECSKCGSAWLTPDTFAAVCRDREVLGALADAVGGTARALEPDFTAKIRYVRCPVCDKMLNRVNFGHRSGVIVDVCKNHGVWFERDELRQVLAFVQRGGLEQMLRDAEEQTKIRQQALGLYAPSMPMPADDRSAAITAYLQASANGPEPLSLLALVNKLFS
jgi:Zn-finger nucleic acid-binding protein